MLNSSTFVNLRTMKIKIFIISLLRSPERRETISLRMSALKIKFEFVDAVDAQLIPPSELIDIQKQQRATKDYGRLLGAGEIACALSHAKAYQTIQNNELDGAVILEDDAIIDSGFPKFIDWLKNQSSVPNGLWLLGGGEYLEKAVKKNYYDFATLSKPAIIPNKPWGQLFLIAGHFERLARTCGYFIDKKSAQTLLANNTPPKTLADDWPFFIKNEWICPYLCKPFLIAHPLEISGQSLIQADRASSQELSVKRKKLSTRLKELVGYYRFTYWAKVRCHHLTHKLISFIDTMR